MSGSALGDARLLRECVNRETRHAIEMSGVAGYDLIAVTEGSRGDQKI